MVQSWKIFLCCSGSGATGGVLTSDGELLFSRDRFNFTSVDDGEEESEKPLARLSAGDFCLIQVQIVSTGFHSWKLTYKML